MRGKTHSGVIVYILVSLVVLVEVGIAYSLNPLGTDDAYITYRIAHNIARGFGSVYNIGEKVEVATTFIWPYILALSFFLDCPIHTFAVTASVFLLLTLPIISGANWDDRLFNVCFVSLIPLSAYIATSGMETVLFLFILVTALRLHIVHPFVSHLVLGGLVFIRPEGTVLLFLHIVSDFFTGDWRGCKGYALGGSMVLAYYVGRYTIYGSITPNTFTAKFCLCTEQILNGIRYMLRMLKDYPLLIYMWGVLFLFTPLRIWNISSARLSAILFSAFLMLWTIIIGGDVLPGYRFAYIATILVALANREAFLSYFQILRRSPKVTDYYLERLLLIITLALSFWSTRSTIRDAQHQEAYMSIYKEAGLLLANASPKYSDSIVYHDIGAIGFFSDKRIIDLVGLSDRWIASTKHALGLTNRVIHRRMPQLTATERARINSLICDYIFKQQPKFIIHRWRSDTHVFSEEVHFHNLDSRPEFTKYDLLTEMPLENGGSLVIFSRRE